jgi:hypothetical protein
MKTTRGGHPVEFWARRAREHNELSHLGSFLLSTMVQSASCERIFKSWMLFHSKFRNRLLPHKTQAMNPSCFEPEATGREWTYTDGTAYSKVKESVCKSVGTQDSIGETPDHSGHD